ncbi:MAG: cobalamin-dependent protein [Dehalococcoidales bacterium]|nr:cobalamin-dependent protein [Dehalococcoidales bacterium]
MKILLLTPPTDLARSYGGLKEFSNPEPSLGLAYIAALLRENGYDVAILDGYVNQFSVDETAVKIAGIKPDILGISVLTTSAFVVEKIVEKVQKLLPDTLIVMGNLHASLFAEELLTKKQADVIVHQEGEYTMLELADAVKKKTGLETIKGISYLKNGTIQNNELRPFIENLDTLPFPAWDLFEMEKYQTDPRTSVKGRKQVLSEMQILASRGCPYACTFCSSRTTKSQGNKYRMRKPERVVDEIEHFHNKYRSTVFSFSDLAFPLVKSHAIQVCEEIIKRGLNKKISWFSEPRVKPLDRETLRIMKQSGCARVCFGIESGNQETIDALKKGFTLDDVRQAVAMAKFEGLDVDGMFMLGLPGETKEMSWKTINFAKELGVRFAILNLFVPYPGCELYDVLKSQNKIKATGWDAFTSYPSYGGGEPVYVPDGRTRQELIETQNKGMRSFYLQPRFILRQLRDFRFSDLRKYYAGLKTMLFPRRK